MSHSTHRKWLSTNTAAFAMVLLFHNPDKTSNNGSKCCNLSNFKRFASCWSLSINVEESRTAEPHISSPNHWLIAKKAILKAMAFASI